MWSISIPVPGAIVMALDAQAELSARQRGDFQTPAALARKVWATIDVTQFDVIIEPTFGLGSFLVTIPGHARAKVVGWEIHGEYQQAAAAALQGHAGTFHLLHGDVLNAVSADIDAPRDSSLLVIGNPPWVTNSEQGSLGGRNTGRKHNLKNLAGLDALTGKSNFDLAEAIILHLIGITRRYRLVQFALLAKFTVLRNIMQLLGHTTGIGDFEYQKIDAARYFGAGVDAGLIKFRLGEQIRTRGTCAIYQDVGGGKIGEIGLQGDQLVYDLESYRRNAFMARVGPAHYVWRQGVKHDMTNVLELCESAGRLLNRHGEVVEIEPEVLYQLYKSSDIYHHRKSRFVVPVYQRDLQDSLGDLEEKYPKLYAYLKRHEAEFRARKSSIYKKRHPFSMFGVGAYTHSIYKVAIGALYPDPVFRLLEPSPRPAVLDDTGYMLATNDRDEAIYLLALLNLDSTREYLCSVSYAGDKRRFSKDVLAKVLIPPAQACPGEIAMRLRESWLSQQSFSTVVMQQLRDWVRAYTAPQPQQLLPGLDGERDSALGDRGRQLHFDWKRPDHER